MAECNAITHNVSQSISLPTLSDDVISFPDNITSALGIPRSALASRDEIEHAWQGIPRELRGVASGMYAEQFAPMCIAVSVGLFDSAINYIWNATILNLRERIRHFGLSVVASIKDNSFDERRLLSLQDSELLDLCSELGVIEEDAHFFLNQCRDIRNKCSAAHPALGQINDREFINYFNRCVRYALGSNTEIRGVDVHSFINQLKARRFADEQKEGWISQLRATYNRQRQLLIETSYGIYCDPNAEEFSRQNALDICRELSTDFDGLTKSMLINRHNEYRAKGDTTRYKASSRFFESIGCVSLLDNVEQHAIVSTAVKRLWNVHLGVDNFYNEPPFAERLLAITKQSAVPETVQEEYVQVVVHCYLGNAYGVSWGAERYYAEMISAFSSKEIAILLTRAQEKSRSSLGEAARNHKARFRQALDLIDSNSVPDIVKDSYAEWLA